MLSLMQAAPKKRCLKIIQSLVRYTTVSTSADRQKDRERQRKCYSHVEKIGMSFVMAFGLQNTKAILGISFTIRRASSPGPFRGGSATSAFKVDNLLWASLSCL